MWGVEREPLRYEAGERRKRGDPWEPLAHNGEGAVHLGER